MDTSSSENEGGLPSDGPPPSRWRRRFTVSVRALMAFVLVAGGGVGWVVHRARVQREAVAAIRQAGGRVFYDWEQIPTRGLYRDVLRPNPNGRPGWPKWLVDHLGP